MQSVMLMTGETMTATLIYTVQPGTISFARNFVIYRQESLGDGVRVIRGSRYT